MTHHAVRLQLLVDGVGWELQPGSYPLELADVQADDTFEGVLHADRDGVLGSHHRARDGRVVAGVAAPGVMDAISP